MLDGKENLSEQFLSLQHLKFQKHEVILFYLSEKMTEFQLDFPNTPHNFIDLELKKK